MARPLPRPPHLRQRLAGTARLARTVADPRTARTLLTGLLRARPSPPGDEVDGADEEPPAWLGDFGHTVAARHRVAAPPEAVMAVLAELGRLPDWLTLHTGWRDGEPPPAEVGASFVQHAAIMDIPADLRWTVEELTEDTLTLRGKGPMGLVLGLGLTLTPATVTGDSTAAAATTVRLDAGLDGQPVRGPLGTSIIRSLGGELEQSLARLEQAVAGSPGSRPVLHHPSGTTVPAATPVIVGVGQAIRRIPDPTADPAALAVEALRRAGDDAGAPGLLAEADTVLAVPSASWTYADAGALVAERVGAAPVRTIASSPYGGDGAQLLVNHAAGLVAEGTSQVSVVVGAEAGATLAAMQQRGETPDWPVQHGAVSPTEVVGVDKRPNTDAETAVGLGVPVFCYALMESAVRGVTGRSPGEHRQAIARLWSRFSESAARNPWAWQPTALTAEEIAEPTPDNRMVSEPYTKLMCANLQVDLGSGLVVCSAAAAEAAGVPPEQWVFVHAGAWAADEWFLSERADLAASPAIRAIGQAALDHADVAIEDVAHVDLYSCFPAAVQIAARELGLPEDDPDRPLTVTGGLTFAGGPGNNYGSHAIASLVPLLRAEPGSYGLSTSLGWYATKHALGLYSTVPPAQPYAHRQPLVDHPPPRRVRQGYTGEAVVEAWTVPWSRAGEPEAVVVSALTPDGDRVLVRSEEPAVVSEFTGGDPRGWTVGVTDGTDLAVLRRRRRRLPAPPPPPVLVERHGPVTVITLNRPEVRNAVDGHTARLLERAVDRFEADPEARVAVLTGAGAAFSAGMDLRAAHRGELPYGETRGPLGLTERPPVKPLVAAVEGSALAGGCELALAADLIVAAEDAWFGLPEPKRGLVAAAGGAMRLAGRLPHHIAMELTLTGDPMGTRRLAELGLVNEVTPPGQALDVALDLAGRIAANAPLSVTVGKQVVTEAADWPSEEAFARQSALAAPVISSADAAEGIAAFTEKRSPQWTGE